MDKEKELRIGVLNSFGDTKELAFLSVDIFNRLNRAHTGVQDVTIKK